MASQKKEEIARLYTQRHELREGVFGDKPYANFGYWTHSDITIDEACDALTDLVATAAGIGPGSRVLEVGCGYGAGAVRYTQSCRPASVLGIDATELRIDKGREYIAQQGLADTVQIRVGDATHLDLDDEAFTQVIAVECAFHFPTRRDFLREAARVLVPGGRLAVADIIPRYGVDLPKLLSVAPSFKVAENFYDAAVYAGFLREVGFESIQIRSITDRTTTPFTDYLERVGRQTPGMRGLNFVRTAQIYRQLCDAGADYVLVSAQKPERGASGQSLTR
jgi:cyclopropane fatty-acyl-phospholipid synthase-like methyltransferase